MNNDDLGLTGILSDDWFNYTKELNGAGVTLQSNKEDTFMWSGKDNSGDLSVKNGYDAILSTQAFPVWCGWQRQFWNWRLSR